MALSSLGPAGLDPFTPTAGPPPEENHEVVPEPVRESAPLPEDLGTRIDTSA